MGCATFQTWHLGDPPAKTQNCVVIVRSNIQFIIFTLTVWISTFCKHLKKKKKSHQRQAPPTCLWGYPALSWWRWRTGRWRGRWWRRTSHPWKRSGAGAGPASLLSPPSRTGSETPATGGRQEAGGALTAGTRNQSAQPGALQMTHHGAVGRAMLLSDHHCVDHAILLFLHHGRLESRLPGQFEVGEKRREKAEIIYLTQTL